VRANLARMLALTIELPEPTEQVDRENLLRWTVAAVKRVTDLAPEGAKIHVDLVDDSRK